MSDIGVQILSGDGAEQAFGHLVERDPEEMRAQNRTAFQNINLLADLMRSFSSTARLGEAKVRQGEDT